MQVTPKPQILILGAACSQEGENLTALLVWIDKEPLKGSVLFVVRPLRICPHTPHNSSATLLWVFLGMFAHPLGTAGDFLTMVVVAAHPSRSATGAFCA